jgi:nucleoside 2-deoxyribosyltransferase
MKELKVYLCGPINGCTDAEAKNWREYVKAKLPSTIDPMRRDYRGREAECVDEIVELDKIDVTNSDVLLVNYDKPSVGTSMEVLYAFERGKLVVVVCRGDASISPWLRYHSHKIFPSFEEAIAYISDVGAQV